MTQPTYTSGLLFIRAYKAVRASVYGVLEKYDMNPSYWAVLSISVRAEEGVRLAQVAEEMNVKAPLVTMLANNLISRGLIIRTPHQSDRRAKLLLATAKGREWAEQIESKLSQEIARLLQGVGEADVRMFRRILEVIIANARSADV